MDENKEFFLISSKFLNTTELSLSALGLSLTIWTKFESNFSLEEISKCSRDSIEETKNFLQELISAGFVKETQENIYHLTSKAQAQMGYDHE